MSLKDIFKPLAAPLFSGAEPLEQNHLCKFGRRHHEKQFCEIILNLDQCSGDVI